MRGKLFIYFIHLIILLQLVRKVVAGTTILPESEYNTLCSLYSSTNGPEWNWKSIEIAGNIWNFSSTVTVNIDPCQNRWQGVKCSPSCFTNTSYAGNNECSILSLVLEDYNMNGKLPQDIGNFNNLKSLVLNNNELYGELPISLYKIINLVNLNLANNQLSGLISSDIGFLQNLRLLDLSQNQFTGELPSTIGLLDYVRHIDLSLNQLSSSIPLELLSLQSLEVLLLQNNCFNSNIPDSMVLLQNLRTFDVSNNNLSGAIPSSLFNLPSIESVVFTKNCFTGSIPTAICNAKSLVSIDFDGLTSGKSCSKSLAKSYTISYFHGTYPSCIFQLPNLALLHLSGNGLHGQLPQNIEISSSLRNVSLSYNRLSGSLPIAFQTFPFQKFDVSYNKISGTTTHVTMNLIPTDMYPEKPTTVLSLQLNRISGPLAPAFHTASIINVVKGNLYDCEFISELPVNDPGTPSTVCGTQVTNISFYLTLAFMLVGSIIFCFYTMRGFHKKRNKKYSSMFSQTSNIMGNNIDSDNSFLTTPLNKNYDNTNKFNNLVDKNDILAEYENNPNIIEMPRNSSNTQSLSSVEKYLYLLCCNLCSNNTSSNNNVSNDNNSNNNNHNNSNFLKLLKQHTMTKSLFQWLNITYEIMKTKPTDLRETTRFLNFIIEIRNFFWVVTIYILTINLPTYLGLRYVNNGEFNTHQHQYAYIPSIAFLFGEVPVIVIFFMIVGCSVVILYIMTKIQIKEDNNKNNPKMLLNSTANSAAEIIEKQHKMKWRNYITRQLKNMDNPLTATLSEKVLAKIMLYLTIPMINFIVTIAANVGYIYVIIYRKREYKLMIVTLLSIFKMMWNMLVIPIMMQKVKGAGVMFTRKLMMQMIIMIFNIVVAPIIANAIVSPDCLQHIFFPAAALEATTQINVCDSYDIYGDCVVSSTRAVMAPYNPPFMYGFQCSSSTLINYAPAFIQMYSLIAVIMPLVAITMFAVMQIDTYDENLRFSHFYCCIIRIALFLQNLKTIPPIYKNATLLGQYEANPQHDDILNMSQQQYYNSNISNNNDQQPQFNQIYESDTDANFYVLHNDSDTDNGATNNISTTTNNIDNNNNYDKIASPVHSNQEIPSQFHQNIHTIRNAPKQTILNPDTIFSHLMSHIMVLITFGFAYPPLAVLITFTVSVVTCQWQVLVGRYLQQISTREKVEFELLKIQIEVGCYGINRHFFRSTKWIIICGMSAFFILFGFDMIADQAYENPTTWLWGILIYGLYPIPLWLFYQLFLLRLKIFEFCQPWVKYMFLSLCSKKNTDNSLNSSKYNKRNQTANDLFDSDSEHNNYYNDSDNYSSKEYDDDELFINTDIMSSLQLSDKRRSRDI